MTIVIVKFAGKFALSLKKGKNNTGTFVFFYPDQTLCIYLTITKSLQKNTSDHLYFFMEPQELKCVLSTWPGLQTLL